MITVQTRLIHSWLELLLRLEFHIPNEKRFCLIVFGLGSALLSWMTKRLTASNAAPKELAHLETGPSPYLLSAPAAFEEAHRIGWHKIRILKIWSNHTYRNYKQSAHIAYVTRPVKQPNLQISPIPHIGKKTINQYGRSARSSSSSSSLPFSLGDPIFCYRDRLRRQVIYITLIRLPSLRIDVCELDYWFFLVALVLISLCFIFSLRVYFILHIFSYLLQKILDQGTYI